MFETKAGINLKFVSILGYDIYDLGHVTSETEAIDSETCKKINLNFEYFQT